MSSFHKAQHAQRVYPTPPQVRPKHGSVWVRVTLPTTDPEALEREIIAFLGRDLLSGDRVMATSDGDGDTLTLDLHLHEQGWRRFVERYPTKQHDSYCVESVKPQ